MKTIKEKAKRYDEALERAKDFMNGEVHYELKIGENIMCWVFPELKESEDERIRKALLEMVHDTTGDSLWVDYNVHKEDAIAWLEKQGEQKPAENKGMNLVEEEMTPFQKKVFCIIDTTIEEEQGLKQVCDELLTLASNEIKQKPTTEIKSAEESLGIDSDTYNKIVDECIYGEQKPTDKVEQKFKVGQTIKKEGFNSGFPIVKIKNGFYYNDMGDNFPFTDQDNWKLVEQKPADWSEEDEKIRQDTIGILRIALGNSLLAGTYFHSLKASINWLKSIKDRVQPKQEWSEEDEDIVKDTIYFLDTAKKHYASTIELDACIEWLKSLRPQKQWKPSDEQMKALDDVISSKDIKYDVLSELYKDLKKLREE